MMTHEQSLKPKCAEPTQQLQRMKSSATQTSEVPSIVDEVLASPGQPLDVPTRSIMERRFGHDFSKVRVHTDAKAAESAKAVNAQAFTVGSNVVFEAGQYAPSSVAGQQLLRHELTHVVQQAQSHDIPDQRIVVDPSPAAEEEATSVEHANFDGPVTNLGGIRAIQRYSGPKYSPQEKADMVRGNVKSDTSDEQLASKYGFQPGDIVFRKGSVPLAFLIDENVTHGGLYVGNGLLHDMVAFGNRTVRATLFFSTEKGEVADPSVVKVVRFHGPMKEVIVPRVLSNIATRNYWLPTDPKPWNLFSTADDYKTATCLEYVHAQFLYAIGQLAVDASLTEPQRNTLRKTYFKPGAQMPSPLVSPKELSLRGSLGGGISSSGGMNGSTSMGSAPSAIMQASLIRTAADAAATDVDQNVFENRDEGNYAVDKSKGFLADLIMGMTDTWTLRTLTFSSFQEATAYFSVVR